MTNQWIKIAVAGLFASGAFVTQAAEVNALDTCIAQALAKHPGKIVSLASETEENKKQYELDIKGHDDRNWEIECDAKTGKINRVEQEISPNDPAFKSKAKIRLDQAIKLALDKYPGHVVNIEYDLEDDGEISYEFIIETTKGETIEIEVDAVSGQLAGFEKVHYRIGH
jgi:uncharacterized membrane protein YkoI